MARSFLIFVQYLVQEDLVLDTTRHKNIKIFSPFSNHLCLVLQLGILFIASTLNAIMQLTNQL